MKRISNITSSAKQFFVLTTDNGENIDVHLKYLVRMESWYISFTYKDVTVNNLKICLHPNLLRQFSKVFNWGLAVTSRRKIEPFTIDAFSSGDYNLILLNSDDVETIESNIFNE